jgi:hypothetical protein
MVDAELMVNATLPWLRRNFEPFSSKDSPP